MTRPEAPFEAPWQAELFALTVALNEAGQFTWSEWAACFGLKVQNAPTERYWEVWSEALVALLEDRNIAPESDVRAMAERWQSAARGTPHGEPITLARAPRDGGRDA